MRIGATRHMMTAFVLAFLCLNAAGAFCLSLCAGITTTAAASDDSRLNEHCQAMKREALAADSERTKAAAVEPSCCMLPVAMLAVPIERSVKFDANAVAVMPDDVPTVPTFVPVSIASVIDEIPVYRPPPLDRRVERIQNCVFRI